MSPALVILKFDYLNFITTFVCNLWSVLRNTNDGPCAIVIIKKKYFLHFDVFETSQIILLFSQNLKNNLLIKKNLWWIAAFEYIIHFHHRARPFAYSFFCSKSFWLFRAPLTIYLNLNYILYIDIQYNWFWKFDI